MKRLFVRALFVIVPLLPSQHGCSSPPPPRPVYQDAVTSVRLYVDQHAGTGHSHPAKISQEEMARVLAGMRVIPRSGLIGSLITGQAQASPAFSTVEIQALAPKLVHALAVATPLELVTFYRRFSDATVGLAVTSGGMFLEDRHLYVILANDRTLPADGMNQNIVSDFDPVDSPLIPISRTSFRADFNPATALVSPSQRKSWPYIDEGRVLVIDLQQLNRDVNPPSMVNPSP